ncbi:PTS transporter subunit EIIC [Halobacillus faecis]
MGLNYAKTAKDIMENVGGVDNIKAMEHCATRLRIMLKDEDQFNREKIEDIKGVKGVLFKAGQFQIILGTGTVNEVYREAEKLGSTTGGVKEEAYNNMSPLQKLIRVFGDIFIPIIPVIVASGILMGLRSFLTNLGWLEDDTFWYKFSQILTDTPFAFLPALVGWSAMKRFGGTPIFGFIIGLMLVHPILPSGGAVGRGNLEPILVSLFGFESSIVGYQGSVIPVLGVAFIAAYLEKRIRKIIPDSLDLIITPFIVMTVGLFIGLFAIGPVARLLESSVVDLFQMLFTLPVGIGGLIIGSLQQVLVITGLHHALWVIDINFLQQTGENIYQPIRSAAVAGQAGAVLAFALFAKNRKQKALAYSAAVSAWFGITEPAIFGINLVNFWPFIFGLIGSGIGAMYSAAIGLTGSGMGIAVIPGILLHLDGSMLQYTIVNVIAGGIPFVLTTLFLKKKNRTKSEDKIEEQAEMKEAANQ